MFRYEVSWELKEESSTVIKKAWIRIPFGVTQFPYTKQNKCQSALRSWRRNIRLQEEGMKRSNLAQLAQIQGEGNGDHIDFENQLQEAVVK